MRKILVAFIFFLLPSLLIADCTPSCESHQKCQDSKCVHKDFFPVLPIEFFGYCILCLVTLFTTVGGITGGIFYLPIFTIIFSFTISEAIPLSITNVMGVLLFRYLLSIRDRHPRRDKPLIHYEISIIFCPAITVGTIFGVLVNRFSPTWLITLFVLVFMIDNGWKTFKKGKAIKQAETLMKGKIFTNLTIHEKKYLFEIYNHLKILETERDYDDFETNSRPKISHAMSIKKIQTDFPKNMSMVDYRDFMKKDSKDIEMSLINKTDLERDEIFTKEIEKNIKAIEDYERIYSRKNKESKELSSNILEDDIVLPQLHDTQRKSLLNKVANQLQEIIRYESQLVPLDKLLYMFLPLGILIIVYLLRGSRNFPSLAGFAYCGWGYWIMQFSFIPFGLLILFSAIRKLQQEYKEKLESAYIFLKNDIQWDSETCKKIALNGLLTGLISAILGIGGAIVIGPLLLTLGFNAAESTATASFLALFTSLSAMVQFLIMGVIKWDYAFLLNIIGIFSMYYGLKLVNYIKKIDKQSLIVFVLAFLIFLSTFLIVISGVKNIMNDYREGKDVLGVKPLCLAV